MVTAILQPAVNNALLLYLQETWASARVQILMQ